MTNADGRRGREPNAGWGILNPRTKNPRRENAPEEQKFSKKANWQRRGR